MQPACLGQVLLLEKYESMIKEILFNCVLISEIHSTATSCKLYKHLRPQHKPINNK